MTVDDSTTTILDHRRIYCDKHRFDGMVNQSYRAKKRKLSMTDDIPTKRLKS